MMSAKSGPKRAIGFPAQPKPASAVSPEQVAKGPFQFKQLVALLTVLLTLVSCNEQANDAQQTVKGSELSFEYLNLKSISIPNEQLCAYNSTLNSLSFAHNQIRKLEQDALSCVALKLKIL